MATDGTRLYLSEGSAVPFTLMQVSVAGGEIFQVQTPFPNTLLSDISPDHAQLLVQDFAWGGPDTHLWTLPVLGGRLALADWETSSATTQPGRLTNNG